MKSSNTLVPSFDVVESAHTLERRSRTTIVPVFSMEQYARAVTPTKVGGLRADSREQDHVPTSRPNPTLDACLSDDEPGTNGVQVDLEMLLDQRPIRGEYDRTNAVLNHRAAFVLLHVNGSSSFREILGQCGIAREDALRILVDLLDRGLLSIPGGHDEEGPRSRTSCLT